MSSSESIGERLRIARRSRRMSLDVIAKKVGVSVATLSRIENSKQGIDLPFFLHLTRAIGVAATDLIGEDGDGNDGLVRRLAAYPVDQRAQIMAAASRDARPAGKAGDLHCQFDALLTTLDVVRDELLEIRRAIRRRN
jgi:transcriptional regulator with XRE-family HTH domain